MNVKQTKILNQALLTKLAWRMLHSPNDLWVQTLKGKYFSDVDLLYNHVSTHGYWVWKGLCEALDIIRQFAYWEVGDGTNIQIWRDRWVLEALVDSNRCTTNSADYNSL